MTTESRGGVKRHEEFQGGCAGMKRQTFRRCLTWNGMEWNEAGAGIQTPQMKTQRHREMRVERWSSAVQGVVMHETCEEEAAGRNESPVMAFGAKKQRTNNCKHLVFFAALATANNPILGVGPFIPAPGSTPQASLECLRAKSLQWPFRHLGPAAAGWCEASPRRVFIPNPSHFWRGIADHHPRISLDWIGTPSSRMKSGSSSSGTAKQRPSSRHTAAAPLSFVTAYSSGPRDIADCRVHRSSGPTTSIAAYGGR
ncbi:hypothetical protein K438DRAFT_1784556 [Mycena galopus ATCC 62051]|nr:hypothetical protein K438DRAFT_1784556 [Mycena galopus ATCC 62051]